METFHGIDSIELFSIHAFVTNEACLLYLKDVVKNTIKACSGFLMSLKIIDTYLHRNH